MVNIWQRRIDKPFMSFTYLGFKAGSLHMSGVIGDLNKLSKLIQWFLVKQASRSITSLLGSDG